MLQPALRVMPYDTIYKFILKPYRGAKVSNYGLLQAMFYDDTKLFQLILQILKPMIQKNETIHYRKMTKS